MRLIGMVVVTGALIGTLSGCASAYRRTETGVNVTGNLIYFKGTHTDAEPQEEKIKRVQVVQGGPSGGMEEIGIVEAVGFGEKVKLEDLIPELQLQASLMDADAICSIESNKFNTSGEALYATAIVLKKKQ